MNQGKIEMAQSKNKKTASLWAWRLREHNTPNFTYLCTYEFKYLLKGMHELCQP